MVPVNGSYARNLHFQDGVLVNYNFTEKEMRDTMNSLQPAVPQWYIQQGDWLIVSMVLAVGVLLRGCLAFVRNRNTQLRNITFASPRGPTMFAHESNDVHVVNQNHPDF